MMERRVPPRLEKLRAGEETDGAMYIYRERGEICSRTSDTMGKARRK